MKIGLGQIDIVWENQQANMEKCKAFMAQAKSQGVEMIIFPEMTLTGFSMNVDVINDNEKKTVKWFSEMAQKYELYVGFGYVVKKDAKATNRFCMLSPKGEEICQYDKIHPFSFGKENDYYQGGSLVTQFDIEGHTFAPSICYDLRFPELFQLNSKHATTLIVIANWPAARKEHWCALLKARAIENQSWMIAVNRYGEGDGLVYSGNSQIIDPMGNVVFECEEKEQLGVAEVQLEKAMEARQGFRLKQDRKTLFYAREALQSSESKFIDKVMLSGKNIVVTGACGLLGKEICHCLGEFGAHLILADINEEAGNDLAIELKKRYGVKAKYQHLDITSEESVNVFAQAVLKEWGTIDGLVNNAYPRNKKYGTKFEDITIESWRENVDMHLNGYFKISQKIIEIMKNQGHGSVINMSSIYGVLGPDFSVYEGTAMTMPAEYSVIKGGIVNFTRYLATYYAKQGVRVNTVSPGGIFDNQPESFVQKYNQKTPLGRMGLPAEIPGTVAFLLSDLASYITGQNVLIDGGWSAW